MRPFVQGMRDGLPIGAGYFAVAFSLGMIARKAGLTVPQGFFSSLLTRASAGEYGTYALMAAGAGLLEVFALCIVANLRYVLMGTALLQKFSADTPLWKKIITGFCITDEIFGISIAYKGHLPVSYPLGALLVASVMWAGGTACGIAAGNILPPSLVSSLSVALYGMFLAIIVAPAKKDRAVLLSVLVSFALSTLCEYLPGISEISSGMRVVILTIIISAAAAVLKPVKDEE